MVYKTSWIRYLGVFHQFCKVLSQNLFKCCTKYPIIPLLFFWYSIYMYFISKPFPLFLFPLLLMYIFFLCFFPMFHSEYFLLASLPIYWITIYRFLARALDLPHLIPNTTVHHTVGHMNKRTTLITLNLGLYLSPLKPRILSPFLLHKIQTHFYGQGGNFPTFSLILYIWLISLSPS